MLGLRQAQQHIALVRKAGQHGGVASYGSAMASECRGGGKKGLRGAAESQAGQSSGFVPGSGRPRSGLDPPVDGFHSSSPLQSSQVLVLGLGLVLVLAAPSCRAALSSGFAGRQVAQGAGGQGQPGSEALRVAGRQ
jgi:hypothetical protein